MKKYKIYALILAAVLTCLAGCGRSQDSIPNVADQTVTEPTTTISTEAELPTDKESSEPPTTAPTITEPTELVTEPTEPATEPTEPESTEPAPTVPVQTEPAVTAPTKEPEPTEPTVEPEPPKESQSTTPKPTQPKPTQPEPTQPKPTTPPPTEPAKHTHQYTAKVVKPTCTKGGYTVHTCSCGDSYTDSKTAPGEHSYDKTTVKPTMWQEGYTVYTCTVCKDSYKDDYVSISSSERKAFIEEVRAATVKHLNKLRVNNGSTSAQTLPKLTKVADYRAKQLQSNYAHSIPDLREALAHFEYGEYLTPEGWDPSEYYYHFPGSEAIARGNWVGTADEIGERIAKSFRNSSGHWSYVGSSEYPYMAVGVSYDPSATGNYYWKICVFVITTDQYG